MMSAASGCPICAGGGVSRERVLYDDRYGFPGEFELYVCSTCRHRWLAWVPEPIVLETLYSEYYPRATRSEEDVPNLELGSRLSAWWHGRRSSTTFWVPRNISVLDIGCGFGEALLYHHRRGCTVQGVEADRNIARVAKHHGLTVHVGLFDPALYAAESFDVVTMNQVIEHMIDPIVTLEGVRKVLRPRGELVLSTPNASGLVARVSGSRWINWHAPYHLHMFSEESLAVAAEQAGLELTQVVTITSSEWLSYQVVHAVTMPKQGTKSPFWTQVPRSLAQRVAIGALRVAHRSGIDHLLTRLCDALGRGDNFVAKLRKPG